MLLIFFSEKNLSTFNENARGLIWSILILGSHIQNFHTVKSAVNRHARMTHL